MMTTKISRPGAPGGERAQDEPMTPQEIAQVEAFLDEVNAASPRPAEPEPPKLTCDGCGKPGATVQPTGFADAETGYVDEVAACADYPNCVRSETKGTCEGPFGCKTWDVEGCHCAEPEPPKAVEQPNTDRQWLREKAEQEGDCIVSVGEPPKAEQEPGGTLRGILKAEIQQQLAYAAKTKPSAGMTTPGEHRHTAGVLRSILTLDDFLRGQASIGRSCGLPVGGDALPCVYPPGHAGRCRDKVMPGPGVEPKRESTGGPLNHAAGSHFVVQPKADTGTLEARLQDAMKFYDYNGGMVDLLRDALTELRRRQEEVDEERRATQATYRAGYEHGKSEARASSPDLRGLVAKWREATAIEGDSRDYTEGRLDCLRACADELEADRNRRTEVSEKATCKNSRCQNQVMISAAVGEGYCSRDCQFLGRKDRHDIAALRKHQCPSCAKDDDEWIYLNGWNDAISAVEKVVKP